MSFAQGSRSRLAYVVETSFGVTPGSPNLTLLPFNSHTLSLSKDTLESGEIRSDRMVDIARHGAYQVQGNIEVDFRADDYDDLIESAMFSTFDTDNIIRIGTTQKFLTIEDGALDIGRYQTYTGMGVNSFAMTVQNNAIVKATFGLMGKTMAVASATIDTDGTVTDSSGNQPYDGNNYIANVNEAGSPIANVTSVEFTLENNMNPAFVIGSPACADMGYGRARITGTMTAHFENNTLLDKFINEVESELEFTLDDNISGNAYRFWFPRIKFNGGDIPVSDESHRFITMPFVALRDSVEDTELLIQKI